MIEESKQASAARRKARLGKDADKDDYQGMAMGDDEGGGALNVSTRDGLERRADIAHVRRAE